MPQVLDSRVPLRVLFVEQAIAFGGAFVVIAELIRRLRRDRVQPSLVTAMDPGFVANRLGGAAPAQAMRHAVDYVRIERVTGRLTSLGVARRPAGYFVTALAALMNLGYSVRLARAVLRKRVDIIHVNNGTEHMESNLVLFALARRCVVHAHGVGRPSRLQRLFLNRAGCVVAISEIVRQRLEDGGVDPERIVVIPNPISLPDASRDDVSGARTRVRRQYSVPDDVPVFGIFGRLVRWKGHREFLLAAEEVIRSVPDAYAMIVGDPADFDLGQKAELRRVARELGIEHRVIFTGFVADVTSYYRAVDVVVHCSIKPEPFGLVITEAMACGVPVVASNRGAPLEIITDSVDGLLVDPERTDLLAAAIRDLLKDGQRRNALAEQAREMVMRRYDPERYARRLEAIYLDVARAEPAQAHQKKRARARTTAA